VNLLKVVPLKFYVLFYAKPMSFLGWIFKLNVI
jgi:hypothetical protein